MPGCVITLPGTVSPTTVSERLDLSFGIFARRGEKYSCYGCSVYLHLLPPWMVRILGKSDRGYLKKFQVASIWLMLLNYCKPRIGLKVCWMARKSSKESKGLSLKMMYTPPASERTSGTFPARRRMTSSRP